MQSIFNHKGLFICCYNKFKYILGQSKILKFFLQNNASVTFEVPQDYPQKGPAISIAAAELKNADRFTFENALKTLASEMLGSPMIMDLVIKLTQLMDDYHEKNVVQTQNRNTVIKDEGNRSDISMLVSHNIKSFFQFCYNVIQHIFRAGLQL